MQFVGITALFDSLICLIALIILLSRRSHLEVGGMSQSNVSYFVKYLVFTFIFLVLIGTTLLGTRGTAQTIMVFISDLFLWTALSFMIAFAFEGRSKTARNTLLVIFFIVALSRSFYQLSGILGAQPSLSPAIVHVLSSLDLWLMYSVWVPTALYFIIISLVSQSSLVRTRSLMFAIGLLLITFTWAFRTLSPNPSFMVVSVASVFGFALLLGGVIYKGRAAAPAMA